MFHISGHNSQLQKRSTGKKAAWPEPGWLGRLHVSRDVSADVTRVFIGNQEGEKQRSADVLNLQTGSDEPKEELEDTEILQLHWKPDRRGGEGGGGGASGQREEEPAGADMKHQGGGVRTKEAGQCWNIHNLNSQILNFQK